MNEQQSESQSAEREQATPAKKPHPAWSTLYPVDGKPGAWGPSEPKES